MYNGVLDFFYSFSSTKSKTEVSNFSKLKCFNMLKIFGNTAIKLKRLHYTNFKQFERFFKYVYFTNDLKIAFVFLVVLKLLIADFYRKNLK